MNGLDDYRRQVRQAEVAAGFHEGFVPNRRIESGWRYEVAPDLLVEAEDDWREQKRRDAIDAWTEELERTSTDDAMHVEDSAVERPNRDTDTERHED